MHKEKSLEKWKQGKDYLSKQRLKEEQICTKKKNVSSLVNSLGPHDKRETTRNSKKEW